MRLTMKSTLGFALTVCLLLVLSIPVIGAYKSHNNDQDSNTFLAAYPQAKGTKLDNCYLCHTGGKISGKTKDSCDYCHSIYGFKAPHGNIMDTLNQFGKDYLANGKNQAAFTIIAQMDSDADGYSNAAEIIAGLLPGDAKDNPAVAEAPHKLYNRADIRNLNSVKQFMALDTNKSGDYYAEYKGVDLWTLLKDAGVADDAATITVYAIDGFSKNFNISDLKLVYEQGKFFTKYPWISYPLNTGYVEGQTLPGELHYLLAYENDGRPLVDGKIVITSDGSKLDGEGPYRFVTPLSKPVTPDRSAWSIDRADPLFPYNYNRPTIRNADYCIKSVVAIQVNTATTNSYNYDYYGKAWEMIEKGQLVVYGALKPTVPVTNETKEVTINQNTVSSIISIPEGVSDASINIAALLPAAVVGAATITSNPLPELTVKSNTAIAALPVEMFIPAGTTITASKNWNGKINTPVVRDNNSVTVTPVAGKTSSVSTVIEIGATGNIPLTFSKSVRIKIPNQAGKLAGCVTGGVFTPITRVLSDDNQTAADAEIPANGEGMINVGQDMIIWTKHFTQFVSYTQTSTGGGGGGSSSIVSSQIGISGGTVNGAGASIIIPTNAIGSTINVQFQKVYSSDLAVPTEMKLLSDVLDISKNQSEAFSKPVTITMSFDKTKMGTADYDIGLFWFDTTSGKWNSLENVSVDLAASKVSGQINHFTRFAVLAKEKGSVPATVSTPAALTDIGGHWAEQYIKELAASGIISGNQDGSYKPDNSISRAEFATLLVKAFKLAPGTGKVFADTDQHWAKEFISTAATNGIVAGYSDSSFGPNDLITREQMAIMIVRAAKLADATDGKEFADASLFSSYARNAILTASKHGIISGYPDNTFKPQGQTTRAEAAVVVSKALK